LWTKKTGRLNSIHRSNKPTVGAVLFPLSLFLCAGFYWRIDPLIFQGAALILGLSDGLAGLIGQKIGTRSYRIMGHKTIEGSFIFFAITCGLLLFLLNRQNIFNFPQLLIITGAALLLTAVEGALSQGWDNLPVPLLAGLVIHYLL
jgi:dolichol kinase